VSRNAWIIFGVICLALFSGLIVLSGLGKIDVSKVNENAILSATKNSGNIADHVFGNKDAKVTLIEYGDFQCPGCGAAHPIVQPLSEKYKDKLAFVFRNFPLTNIHPNARFAAAAVETAGLMGKYWEMHNLVYDNQNDWSDASDSDRTGFFASYASQIGLNKNTFLDMLDSASSRINQKISFDQALGRKINVEGTPTFILDGRQLSSSEFGDQASFEKALTSEFKKKGVDISKETASKK
jgi:protein-disulfide isomerase